MSILGKQILIATFTFPPQKNGVSHVVEAHASGLSRLGYNITVVTGKEPARIEDALEGVKVRQFDTRGDGRCIHGGYGGDVSGYQDFVASFRGDLIICHCWQIWSTDLAIKSFARLHCPKVLVSHGVSARWLRKSLRGLVSWIEWKPYLSKMPAMMRKFDHVVTLADQNDSHDFYDRMLMDRIGYQKHSVIPNGVYMDRFDSAQVHAPEFRAKHNIGNKPMLLYVANYDLRKNQKMAVKAFIRAAIPEAVFVLIGSEINEYARGVCSFTHRSGEAGRRVVLLENLSTEDIAAAYCAADLFLCSSRWELQPLMILEAMAAGKPFICTDVGCVRDFPGGIIVRNLKEMVLAIRNLAEDEPRRQNLGRQGKAAVEDRYNWGKVVQQYDILIKKLCSY